MAVPTTNPFESCRYPNPDDPDMECLSRKGHSNTVPHAVDVHLNTFDGPGYLVEWTDTEVVTDERPSVVKNPPLPDDVQGGFSALYDLLFMVEQGHFYQDYDESTAVLGRAKKGFEAIRDHLSNAGNGTEASGKTGA